MTADSLVPVLEEARDLGFLGPGPVSFHVEHARAYLPALEGVTGEALDLGAGGGVPGLVLATERSDLAWTFVDAMTKRTAFLERAARALGLAVAVVTGRAEVLARTELRARFSAVVARSFGAPAVTAECAAPFLVVGGRLIVSEPPVGEERWAVDGMALLGCGPAGILPGPPRLVVAEQVSVCGDRYPRRVGVPTKRPLW